MTMVVALAVASCSASDSGTTAGTSNANESTAATAPATAAPPVTEAPTTTTTAPPIDETAAAYGVELAAVDEDGNRTLESSLRLFAIGVAPLPGVDVSFDQTGVTSGTLALRDVLAHYDELTPEQQAVVDAIQRPPAGAETAVIPAGFAPRPKSELRDQVDAAAQQMRSMLTAKLGPIPGPINVSVAEGSKYLGLTSPVYTGGAYIGCNVQIFANAVGSNTAILLNTIAHEVFHCFEGAAAKTLEGWRALKGWLLEGAAEWAAADLLYADGTEAGWWAKYLTGSLTSLFARTYDAIGFFSHLDEIGINPWSVFNDMFAAGTSQAAFDASGANSDAFMSTWSSGFFRDPGRGAAWDTDGPGITADKATPDDISVGNGDNQSFVAAKYSALEINLSISADVLLVQGTGFVRLSDGATDIDKVTSSKFCTKVGGCGVCPDGTPLPDNPPPFGTEAVVAVSSNALESSGNVVGVSVEDYCKMHTAVWFHFDRPASPGVLAGSVVEFYGCDGPFGTWTGVLRSGGLATADGFNVPFAEIPVTFAFVGDGAQSAHTQANGNVPSPIGNVTLQFELDFGIDAEGTVMSVTGSATAGLDVVSVDTLLGDGGGALPIEPAPDGACPK